MEQNVIRLEQKLVKDIQGEFIVPSYQRGYRWGQEEVKMLLKDVYDNGDKRPYYLQPIVVKRTPEGYEVIDGQQRLTTLYLIYSCMYNAVPQMGKPAFVLKYATRKGSEEFLQTIDLSLRDKNVDYWFMCDAIETIQAWFQEQPDPFTAMFNFRRFFSEKVYIIWYEVGDSEDGIPLFTRLNIGKIPLTSAELVKAMFLNRDSGITEEKRDEIALQWDNIERELHNDRLWYFLSNQYSNQYQTRIDLVLNLMARKAEDNREKYYTFFYFEQLRSQQGQSLDDIWRSIQHTFLTLKDWYENHELYHKIGYLIASSSKNLQQLYKLVDGKTKDEFTAALNDEIRASIKIDGNYSDLSYEKQNDYKWISKLLLLFNVESVRLNGEQTEWFPFNKFKYNDKGESAWSLEHIHAQQSEGLQKQEVWKEWLKLHIPSVKAVDEHEEHSDLIQRMEAAMNADTLTRIEFDMLQSEAVACLSVEGNTEYLHSIANLALLNAGDNAALNNSTFDVKRNKIIELDKCGEYIPFCTKMVFLKYYSPSENNQLHFWGQSDRIAYISAMNSVLHDYLEEEIQIETEAK